MQPGHGAGSCLMNNKKVLLTAKIAVSIALLWIVYRDIPLAAFREQLQHINPVVLLPIFALLLLNTFLSAWKWRILLNADGIHVPLSKLFATYLVGSFFNIFLPSSIGGDAYRVYDIGKHTARLPNAFASVLADRLSGFVALVILSILASVPVAARAGQSWLIAFPVAAGVALAVAIQMLSRHGPAETLLRVTRVDRIGAFSQFVHQCIECLIVYRRKPGVAIRVMAISFAFQLSMIFCVSLMGQCLAIRTSFFHYVAFVPLIELAAAIPISIYGIGIRDFVYAFLFTQFADVSDTASRSLALLYLFTNVVYAMLGGILFFSRPSGERENTADAGIARLRKAWLTATMVTILIWAIFSWPLPKYVTRGIPSSSQNVELHNTLRMRHGDHLQLLYHFWLASDMVAGNTEFMHNMYEFNTGDDDDRYEPDAYYFPFSAIFTIGYWLSGRAFGWNLAGLVSLIVTYWATWTLARRFTSSVIISAVASLLAILLPYRWHALLGGSPTGFAMSLVPLVALGVDIAVRDGKARGGVLAGMGILLAYFSDLHVFFFSTLSIPFWCLLSLGVRVGCARLSRNDWVVIIKGLLPLVGFGLVACMLSFTTAKGLEQSAMHEGWQWSALRPLSPWRRGLLGWRIPSGATAVTSHIYVGYTLAIIFGAGALALLVEAFSRLTHSRKHDKRSPSLLAGGAPMVMILLGLATIGVVALALGTNGPFSGKLLEICRSVIPHYDMVRQPIKIFCLMPTLLSVACVLSISALASVFPKRKGLICVLFAVALVTEYRRQVSATICSLDTSQESYKSVANDSTYEANPPRALALPIWPGNDAHSSLYQYYASLYRIRMVNGYRPAVPADYMNDVFARLESLNVGVAMDEQLDWLINRGIYHVLLHEDAFPEKVSPFPVSVTLRKLLLNPRLELQARDERVWAFRILDSAKVLAVIETAWDFYFPSRIWEAERTGTTDAVQRQDSTASAERYIALNDENAEIRFVVRSRIGNAPGLHYLLRFRGSGKLGASVYIDGELQDSQTIATSGQEWKWRRIYVETQSEFFTPMLNVRSVEGYPEIDMCLLTAGEWISPAAGETLEIPASCLFHAGYTDLEEMQVMFHPDSEPDRKILYGPNLPLDKGIYDITIRAHAAANVNGNDTFGELSAVCGNQRFGPVTIRPEEESALRIKLCETLPLRIDFRYARTTAIGIEHVCIRRLPDS
jgi:uncharacterized protein (TIRG00374 family)